MKDYALGPISVDFSIDHTFYLPTCHSSVKVVEFRGSNLVIVGAGTAGKGKGKSNHSCPQSTEGFHAVVALYSNHFVPKWADHLYASPAHWGHMIACL